MVYWVTLVFVLFNLLHFSYIPSAEERLSPYYSKEVSMVGRVEPLTIKLHEKGASFQMNCTELNCDDKCMTYVGKIRVFVNDNVIPKGCIKVKGMLKPLNNFYNPGTFDSKLWQKVNNIGGRLSVTEYLIIDDKLTFKELLETYNCELRKHLNRRVGGKEAPLMAGMLLGGNEGIEDEQRELFSNHGLSHLLSVSGTHLLLWTGILEWIFRLLKVKRRKFIILLILAGYALLCGARPPVLRAWLMSGLILWGNSKSHRGYLLCFVAMILLSYNPLWIWDVGFQLSFGATAGIIWGLEKSTVLWLRILPEKMDFLAEALGVVLSAQLFVIPLEIAYFHQLSLIGFLSNIIFVPLIEIVSILTAIGLLIDFVIGYPFVLNIGSWLLKQVIVQAEFLGKLDWSIVAIGGMPLWSSYLYYALVGCWIEVGWAKLLKNKERILSMFVAGAGLMVIWAWYNIVPGDLQVFFLDVGQGDAAVIVTPHRKIVVIDTGGIEGFDTGSRIVAPFIKSLGRSSIDYFIPSHNDYDHIGGGEGLARNIKIKKILMPRSSTQDKENYLQRIIAKSKTKDIKEVTNMELKIEEKVKLEIFPGNYKYGNDNDLSTVVLLKYNNAPKVLFMGDRSMQSEEIEMEGSCLILKAGHHGAKSSSGQALLLKVRPKVAIISCGQGNKYGHPHKETLDRLKNIGAEVLRTDQKGCIRISFRDEKIKIGYFKE